MRRWFALVLGLGCADVPDVERGICGNRILEAGEDCDDPQDARCGEPQLEHACRFVCGAELPCPMGYACADDGLCRAPSGAFDEPLVVEGGAPRWIRSGDLDGDGRDDLVVQVPNANGTVSLRAIFFPADQRPEVVVLHDGEAMEAAVGDLDGDGLDDIFLTGGGSMLMFGGDRDRRPRQKFLPTVRTEGDRGRLLSPLPQRDHVLEFTKKDIRVWASTTIDPPPPSIVAPGRTVDLARSVPFLHFPLLGEGCGFVALPYVGSQAVRLFLACGDGSWNPQGGVVFNNARVGEAGAFFRLVNDGDEFVDLVVQAENGKVFVAYGRGNGTFRSTPPALEEGEDSIFSEHLELPSKTLLLDVANFDADAAPEFFADACLYDNNATCMQEIRPKPEHAVAVDLNGDEHLDAIALSDATLFELYGGSPREVFEVHERPLLGPGRNLEVGDFDRDGRPDVAFIENQQWITVLSGGELERHGPFVAIDDFTVEHGVGIVARVLDHAGRVQGVFMRFGEPQPAFGFELGPPAIGTFASPAPSVALVLADPTHRVAHLPFVPGGTSSAHDLVLGGALSLPSPIASYLALAVELDGDAFDELVLVGPQELGSQLWVAGPFPEAAGLGIETEFVLGPPVGLPGSTIDAGDVDGDGDLDVLLTSSEVPRKLQSRTNTGGFLIETELRDFQPREDLEAGLVRPWHAREDGTARVFVSGELGAAIADVDVENRELHPIRVGPESPDAAIATADVDGDGLLDLVRATGGVLLVYRALALR